MSESIGWSNRMLRASMKVVSCVTMSATSLLHARLHNAQSVSTYNSE